MKPRYYLRTQSSKPIISKPNKKYAPISSSRVFVIIYFILSDKIDFFSYSSTKKTKPRRQNLIINQQNRRHSLRLAPLVKEAKPQTIHGTGK